MSPWIVSTPDILGGKPCVRGTRLSVAFLLEVMASGATREDLLARWPQLTAEGVDAALQYAADALNDEVVWTARIPA